MSQQPIKWPEVPKPLGRGDGVDWHITVAGIGKTGGLVLACNGVNFCVIKAQPSGRWHVPGVGPCRDKLAAMQAAGVAFLGPESRYTTLVSA